jgi:hypothetical protein
MRRFARLEVARDNMGHAGSTGSITVDVYSKTWWEERVGAVNWILEAVFSEPDKTENKAMQVSPQESAKGKDWEPERLPRGLRSSAACPDGHKRHISDHPRSG